MKNLKEIQGKTGFELLTTVANMVLTEWKDFPMRPYSSVNGGLSRFYSALMLNPNEGIHHTFYSLREWNECGYSIKKGEKGFAFLRKNVELTEDLEPMNLEKSFYYAFSNLQVEYQK